MATTIPGIPIFLPGVSLKNFAKVYETLPSILAIVFVVDTTFKGKKRLLDFIQKRAFAVRPQKWLLLQDV